MARTWHENAEEARVLTRTRKDARLAMLIAASVARDAANGKATVAQFAAASNISESTVRGYLTMWDHFASNHPQYKRDRLTPDDAMTLVLDEEAQAEFDAAPIRTKVQDIMSNPGAAATALADPTFAASVAGRLTGAAATVLVANTVHKHPEAAHAANGGRPVVEDDTPRSPRIDVDAPRVNQTAARLRDVNYALDDVAGSIVNLPGRAAYDETLGALHAIRGRIDDLIARGEIARELFGLESARRGEGNR